MVVKRVVLRVAWWAVTMAGSKVGNSVLMMVAHLVVWMVALLVA